MKIRNLLFLAVIVTAIGFFGCGGDDDPPQQTTPPTTPPCTHTWEWVETTPATDNTEGVETKTCTICGATDGTRPIPTILTSEIIAIGGLDFTFVYRRDDTTSWVKLREEIQNYITYIGTYPESPHAAAINNLSARNDATFSVIIDYSNEGKSVEFTAIDGQTIKVGSDYLNDTTINRNTLRNAFNAMLAEPWPIE